MRAAILIAFALMLAGSGAPAARRQEDPLGGLAREVFRLANRERRLHGIRELEWNAPLAEQARLQSMNMVERSFFSHIDPVRGALPARLHESGIPWVRSSENIFREQGMDDPAAAAVEGWMRSPSHRTSLLDPSFTQTGVGIAVSPDTEYFVTQIFIHQP